MSIQRALGRHVVRGLLPAYLSFLGCAAPAIAAAGKESAPPASLPEVVIVTTSPLPGTGISVDKIPGNVQTLRAQDVARNGEPSLLDALSASLGGVNINDDLNDPFQPDVLYHGFEASAVLGVSPGIAVYQSGVRVNEPFGDGVNWDLLADLAIDRIDLVDASPVYGLNALGGALSVTMKSGFTFMGADAGASFGSFSRRPVSAEAGANNGTFGVYAAIRQLHQDGWRYFAGDAIHQYYLSAGVREDRLSLDLSYSRANNQMFGQGAAPVQSLALSTRNVFTGPQAYANSLDFVTLNGNYRISASLSAQGVLYYRHFRQRVDNGNTTNYTACTGPENSGDLCQDDGLTPLTGSSGASLPDISGGGEVAIGENDFEVIRTQGRGGSLQLNDSRELGGRHNQLTAGVSFDSARTRFHSGAQLGVLGPQLVVEPSDLYVDTAEAQQADGYSATPVSLLATNTYQGYYLSDTLDVTQRLSVTAGARYNVARINLDDQRGSVLTGDSRYAHFNPSLGLTYGIAPGVNAFAAWSINNRAPTPSEIECSDPARPCLLPANLAGDPPNLRQVVSRTYEMGLRGVFLGGASDSLRWNVSVFRSDLGNDIFAVSTSLSSGFFQNIGSTRRQGLDGGVSYRARVVTAYAQYSYVAATFQSPFVESSPQNPFADVDGNIQILPGDRLPGVPLNRFKAGAEVKVIEGWTLGAELILASGAYYKGDESNQNPGLPGYRVVNLHSSFHPSAHVEVFASIQNLFNRRYSTFGLYSDPTGVGAAGIPPAAHTNGPGVDNRFQSPAAPLSFYAGIRLRL